MRIIRFQKTALLLFNTLSCRTTWGELEDDGGDSTLTDSRTQRRLARVHSRLRPIALPNVTLMPCMSLMRAQSVRRRYNQRILTRDCHGSKGVVRLDSDYIQRSPPVSLRWHRCVTGGSGCSECLLCHSPFLKINNQDGRACLAGQEQALSTGPGQSLALGDSTGRRRSRSSLSPCAQLGFSATSPSRNLWAEGGIVGRWPRASLRTPRYIPPACPAKSW